MLALKYRFCENQKNQNKKKILCFDNVLSSKVPQPLNYVFSRKTLLYSWMRQSIDPSISIASPWPEEMSLQITYWKQILKLGNCH